MAVNCDFSSSKQFCVEHKIKTFPQLLLLNQDSQKSQIPVEFDLEDPLDYETVFEFVMDHRKNLFSVAPKHEALLKYLDDPEKECTILYFTQQNHPRMFMNNVSIYFNKKCVNLHVPGFEHKRIEVNGGESVTKETQVAVFLKAKKELVVYEGSEDHKLVV